MIAQLDKAFIKARPWKLWSRLLAYGLFEGRPLTTKGQWFNPVVFGFFKLCRMVGYKEQVDDPVFIVGMGRSGTTALGSVLSMHRDVAYLNEPKALWHSIDDNEDLIGSYSKNIGRYRLDPVTADIEKREAVSSVYNALLSLTSSKKIVDKYPELLFRIPYVLALFPNAKFVMLTRNGVDNCESISKWCEVHRTTSGDSKHDWWGKDNRKWNALCAQILQEYGDLAEFEKEIQKYSTDFDRASVEWLLTMREFIASVKQYPENLIRVDYDELCLDPEYELKRLLAFTNLEITDEVMFAYAKKTLSRKTSHAQNMVVDRIVQAPFNQTMHDLGYAQTARID